MIMTAATSYIGPLIVVALIAFSCFSYIIYERQEQLWNDARQKYLPKLYPEIKLFGEGKHALVLLAEEGDWHYLFFRKKIYAFRAMNKLNTQHDNMLVVTFNGFSANGYEELPHIELSKMNKLS